jgi:peptidoglycan/xylan/chitin deacetylase (PgdA/CDA1 family)
MNNKGVIIFSFDHAADPNIAKFVLEAYHKRKLKATLYVQTGLIAAKHWNSTLEDLKVLYDHGWDLGSHSITHASLGYLNEESIEHEVKKSTEDLLKWGFDKSARHFSYPQSSHSPISLEVVKRHCKTARLVTGKLGPIKVEGDDLYKLDCISMKAIDPYEKATSMIDSAIEQGKVAHIMFEMIMHKDPPPQGYLYDKFIQILDYAVEKEKQSLAQSLTLSEWYSNFCSEEKQP